jgi:hypothetical protein
MASVGLAKLLRIGIRIYSVVEAASPPKNNSFKILNIQFIIINFYFNRYSIKK